jgi:SNF2 family DNA or RNA helicase
MDRLLVWKADGGVYKNLDPLRPYQKYDLMYLTQLEAAGVFNEPRTGKTPTMISLVKELGTKRNLIVAPASLIYNWAAEFKQWYPECFVQVIQGKNLKLWDNYSAAKETGPAVAIISKDSLKLAPHNSIINSLLFDVAILDEAHYLRNYKTAQAKAVFKIKAKRRYALTGTPTVKHSADIFGILHFLYPERFPSYWQFIDRYFESHENYWSGAKEVGNPKPERVNELQELIALCSVQRKRKDVMQWLPEKQRSTFNIMVDGKQRKLYDDMKKHFESIDLDSQLAVDAQSVITQLMRLRQLCLDPRLLGFEVPGAKTLSLLEFLDDHRQPMVIMSMFTSYLKLLKPLIEELGLKVGFIHGEMSNKAKQESAILFQQGRINVLLCNIISAGTGFTLDQASTVVFTDKAWNPAENEQAEDRVCPTSEEKNHKHEIITFACQDTVDARIDELLEQKISLTDYINNGGVAALKRLLGR